ncbi:hypothetical protein J2S43_005140 [Catenuloplanes nepalensis]|uniref:Hsp70 protein n=1 Tax=Catenuloplanes nepalensis TaxID=587533 RepID=A0ABT9MYV9_9ACTN|nr:Hsp70 family protein [Catenuloplanes nepalensis]MDP9796628.1 hypothetical protein [Catenuloplanes nepalensis]
MHLAIDLGTSTTVAMSGAPPEALIIDSAVAVTAEGTMLTGADVGTADPRSVEPHPKLRVLDGVVRAGGRELPVGYTLGAILHRAGAGDRAVTLTHPAAWGPAQLAALTEATAWARPAAVRMVPEPIAAAFHLVSTLGRPVPPDHGIAIYDLGAGTFDITVVRQGPAGLSIAATDGLADVSGLHLDAIVVGTARRLTVDTAPDVWSRLEDPRTPDDHRARRQLWAAARTAREELSSQPAAWLPVPMLAAPVEIGRAGFEAEATPLLERTVALTVATMQRSGVPVAGVLPVGGGTRTPLVATLLHRALGVAPITVEAPELVVARGASAMPWPPADSATAPGSAAGPVPAPVSAPPAVPGQFGAAVVPGQFGAAAVAGQFGAPVVAPVPGHWQQPAPWQAAPVPGYPRIEAIEIATDGGVGITLRWIEREPDEDGGGGTHEEPRFLAVDGRVQVFGTADGLVAFLHGDTAHDLRDRPGFAEFAGWATPPALFPAPEHRYGLDLVVTNLAGGRDEWIPELLLGAAALARDLSYALDQDVWTLLAPGSLLDDFDEALRRNSRWKLRGFDPALLIAHWTQVIDELGDTIEFRP